MYPVFPKRIFKAISCWAFILAATATLAPRAGLAASAQPALSVTVLGAPQVVFDTTTQACEKIDIPDIMARAFRDNTGQVHLFASHYVSRAMLGIDPNRLTHSCDIVYNSAQDADPSHFSDYDWLSAFFTLDGKHVIALVHNEYHGWVYAGRCLKPARVGEHGHCWWNSVDFMTSDDGGKSFVMPSPPGNVIAEESAPYANDNDAGAVGYTGPSNIVSYDGAYYFMINAWPYDAQKGGACLLRSTNPFDPTLWRAWDGAGFNIEFVDPYRRNVGTARQITCLPVYAGQAQSLVYNPAHALFLVTEFTQDKRYGAPGIYVSTSPDLLHWAHPMLVISQADLLAQDGPGHWHYDYASLLDPASTDRNFSTISELPYVYYVREDMLHAPLTRRLYRLPIRLNFAN